MQPKETQPDSRARLRGSKLFRYFTLGLCSSTCGTILLASPTTAQLNRSTSGGTCFMVTSSGKQLNLGSLCGEENVPAPKLSKSSIVRLKIKKRYASTPVVNVSFNGKPFEMIFDTGASSTLITQGMANALNIQPTGYREVIIADGSTVKMPVTSIKQISAGGLTNKNIEVTIANKADVGLLGHDFFGNYDIKIKRNEIELHPQQ